MAESGGGGGGGGVCAETSLPCDFATRWHLYTVESAATSTWACAGRAGDSGLRPSSAGTSGSRDGEKPRTSLAHESQCGTTASTGSSSEPNAQVFHGSAVPVAAGRQSRLAMSHGVVRVHATRGTSAASHNPIVKVMPKKRPRPVEHVSENGRKVKDDGGCGHKRSTPKHCYRCRDDPPYKPDKWIKKSPKPRNAFFYFI